MKNEPRQFESSGGHFAMDDATLVRLFANCRDEAAFAELVRRYRGLVYGVARRVLLHRQDAEDVFQATFLVLARDAADIRQRSSVASWLYGVAHRLALKARAQRAAFRQKSLREASMDHATPLAEVARRSDLQTLDEELSALTERDREVLVLRYLMERTNGEIADELGLTEAAVESRLKRSRERLRKRLARRGIGLTAVIAALELFRNSAEATVSDALVTATVRAGLSYTSPGASQPLYSSKVAHLAAKEVSAMKITSLGMFGALTLATTVVVALAVGLSRSTNRIAGGSEVHARSNLTAGDKGMPVRKPMGIRIANTMPSVAPRKDAGANRAENDNLPTALDYKSRTKAETAMEAQLDEPTELNIIDMTLKETMAAITDLHNVPIIFDEKALADAGIPTDTRIHRQLSNITLRSALNIILEPHGLTYVIEDEVMKVTTIAVANETRETRVYEVRQISHLEPHRLVEIIQKQTSGPWFELDGTGGSISAVPGGLVVRHTQKMHREIRNLLKQLSRQPALSDDEMKRFEAQRTEFQNRRDRTQQARQKKHIEQILQRLETLLKKLESRQQPPRGMNAGGGFF